jgi:hypothetical protein
LKACSQSILVGRSDSASGERRRSLGGVDGSKRISVDAGGEEEGDVGVEEVDHHEDQDDEVLGAAAGGVLDASARGCWVGA